ncbi:MAG: hypothetical protein AAB929_03860, partial [Patescibacteria group bacterium]
SSELGRFFSMDAIQFPNQYAYTNGDPINKVDPSGNKGFWSSFCCCVEKDVENDNPDKAPKNPKPSKVNNNHYEEGNKIKQQLQNPKDGFLKSEQRSSQSEESKNKGVKSRNNSHESNITNSFIFKSDEKYKTVKYNDEYPENKISNVKDVVSQFDENEFKHATENIKNIVMDLDKTLISRHFNEVYVHIKMMDELKTQYINGINIYVATQGSWDESVIRKIFKENEIGLSGFFTRNLMDARPTQDDQGRNVTKRMWLMQSFDWYERSKTLLVDDLYENLQVAYSLNFKVLQVRSF